MPTARLNSELNSNVHTYGHGDAVKIHILIRTRYDANVERERSLMYRLEKQCKKYLKTEIAATDRGDERVKGEGIVEAHSCGSRVSFLSASSQISAYGCRKEHKPIRDSERAPHLRCFAGA
eukprot:scaffold32409_cov112-Isochrysis_galbana.AAC.5